MFTVQELRAKIARADPLTPDERLAALYHPELCAMLPGEPLPPPRNVSSIKCSPEYSNQSESAPAMRPAHLMRKPADPNLRALDSHVFTGGAHQDEDWTWHRRKYLAEAPGASKPAPAGFYGYDSISGGKQYGVGVAASPTGAGKKHFDDKMTMALAGHVVPTCKLAPRAEEMEINNVSFMAGNPMSPGHAGTRRKYFPGSSQNKDSLFLGGPEPAVPDRPMIPLKTPYGSENNEYYKQGTVLKTGKVVYPDYKGPQAKKTGKAAGTYNGYHPNDLDLLKWAPELNQSVY